jgi:MoxR-like ATPase
MRITLGYPSPFDEVTIIERQQYIHPIEELDQVAEDHELVELQEAVKGIYVDSLIKHYIVSLVEATRHHPAVHLGASPRGSLALFRASQARALLDDRDYVLPDDVKALAEPTLAHRLVLAPSALAREIDPKTIVAGVIDSTPVPGARVGRRASS